MLSNLGAILCCGIILSSCNVTGPDADVWEDVSTFSWPTQTGVSMKYRSTGYDPIKETDFTETEVVTVDISELDGQEMFVLSDPDKLTFQEVYYLPSKDRLIVKQEEFGEGIALLAPLEKGHKWYTSQDSSWQAEIIERFAYRKVDGKIYQNVVAVRYRMKSNSLIYEPEYIRFYAQGVGDILTIRNVYLSTNVTSQPLPQEEARTELIETTPES